MKYPIPVSPYKKAKKFVKHQWFNTGLVIVTLVSSFVVIAPGNVMADMITHPTPLEQKATALMIAAMGNTLVDYGTLPKADARPLTRTMNVKATAYSSDVAQTDSTPLTTASGTTCRHGVVAANFLPIGTKIKIPKYYGDQVFVVEDRMNARFSSRVDIWMGSYKEAKQFGVRNLEIEVYN